MALPTLPSNIWTQILLQYLLDDKVKLSQSLQLRQVSKWFNSEVLYQLFVVQIKDLHHIVAKKRVPRHIVFLHLQGFFGKRKLPLKTQRSLRKSVLKTVGFDYHDEESIRQSCFCYQPDQICSAQVIGPSTTTIRCKAHDMINAMVSAYGSLAFIFGGQEATYEVIVGRDGRYWSLLVACYLSNIPRVKGLIQDLIADPSMKPDMFAYVACDLFAIAARDNNPLLIDVLFEETKEREDVMITLGNRNMVANALIEAIRLGHCEIVEKLLKWGWKFNHDAWTYTNIINLILNEETYPKHDRSIHEKLLRLMFEWTDTWRNIREMKDFLIYVGANKQLHYLKIAVDTLKTLHYFRHERGEEGTFSNYQPLYSLCSAGDLDMMKLYFENKSLLLPHTTPEQDKEMRRLTIVKEFKKENTRAEIIKIIIENSPDLLETKTELHSVLVDQFDKKLETWGWLAKKIGLDMKSTYHTGHTLGSKMLEQAIDKLNVETVRFLIGNGVQLVADAKTPQIYEDELENMAKLEQIKKLLTQGGQGEYKQRRIVETTFTPEKVDKQKQVEEEASFKSYASIKITPTNGSVKIDSTSAAMFLRRNLALAVKRHSTRKNKKSSSISSMSSLPDSAESKSGASGSQSARPT